jgi:beta-glucanase (GH16 family)
MKKKKVYLVTLVTLALAMVGCTATGKNENETFQRVPLEPDEYGDEVMTQLPNDYSLVWSDEFNYTGQIDQSKWNYEIGAGGWGNNESQYYTARQENSYVSDGHLTIRAQKESYSGSNYTSARLTTKAKGDWTYGYVEIRAKLPTGKGTWPALWMMPTSSVYGGWPNSGEIDIMETTGYNTSKIQGTVHTTVSGGSGNGGATYITNSTSEYNNYGLEWTSDSMKFKVNGQTYYTYNRLSGWDSTRWPFDQNFFIILNIAMGGNMGGAIDSSFTNAEMLVDYVRVYSKVDKTDKEAPSEVELTSVVPTSDAIHLEWEKPSDNQGIKHYEIVVDNRSIGATISRSYTVKKLSPGTTYQVRIVAVDYNDNWSISPVTSIKTLSMEDCPGEITGYAYSTVPKGKVRITGGSDSNGSQVLAIATGTSVTYDVNCTRKGTYEFALRLAIQLNTSIELVISQNDQVIHRDTMNVGASYGKYQDASFPNKVDLPNGRITIQLTIADSSNLGDAILFNYLSVK